VTRLRRFLLDLALDPLATLLLAALAVALYAASTPAPIPVPELP
jgi:hypothetical protein